MAGGVVVRVIDERVGLSFSAAGPRDVLCKKQTALKPFFEGIVRDLGGTKMSLLLLMTHAFYEPDPVDGGHRYGFGIELGTEGLHNGRLDMLLPLVGHFVPRAIIELRGCGVAVKSAFGPRSAPTRVGDGVALCQEIADLTRCFVIASSDEQPGSCVQVTGESTQRGPSGLPETKTITTVEKCDVGTWTGNVWRFTPGQGRPGLAKDIPSLPR